MTLCRGLRRERPLEPSRGLPPLNQVVADIRREGTTALLVKQNRPPEVADRKHVSGAVNWSQARLFISPLQRLLTDRRIG